MAAGDSAHAPRIDDHEGTTDEQARCRFADACGMHGAVRLMVTNLQTGVQTKHDLSDPFALIGRPRRQF